MTGKAKGLVVLCSHPLRDALVGPLMLDYVLKLQRAGGGQDVLLVTEESGSPELEPGLAAQFRELRITWSPLVYRIEGRQWIQKMANGLRTLRRVMVFLRGRPQRHILGYLSYAGTYATLLGMLGLGRTITVCFEPHSLYMLEMGIWPKRGLKYKVVGWLERLQMRRQDVLVVPTTAVREHALRHGRTKAIHLQGITIDVLGARHDPKARERLRTAQGWHGHTVIAYVGKFGGIYHSLDQYVRFMLRLLAADPGLRFLVITQHEWVQALEAHEEARTIRDRIVVVPPVPPAELPGWLSAADLGVIAVPPTPSQAFRTPVKSAYYWAAGLPIIVPKGVSDDHLIAAREDVGVVVKDLPDVDGEEVVRACHRYRAMDAAELRARCQGVAMAQRDTGRMVSLLKTVLE